VRNSHCASASALVQLKYSIFENIRILCERLPAKCLQVWIFRGIMILLCELLYSSLANFKLLCVQTSIQINTNNNLPYPADIVLVKFHFTW